MRLLRQIKTDIDIIKNDMKIDKLGVRDECDKYIIYVDALLVAVVAIIKELKEKFEYWGSLNISMWKSDCTFLKRYACRFFCEMFMEKISIDIHNAEVCQNELNSIRMRLNQIKYLL